jgi:hypothetical protein
MLSRQPNGFHIVIFFIKGIFVIGDINIFLGHCQLGSNFMRVCELFSIFK